jgi:hypothetical protein
MPLAIKYCFVILLLVLSYFFKSIEYFVLSDGGRAVSFCTLADICSILLNFFLQTGTRLSCM